MYPNLFNLPFLNTCGLAICVGLFLSTLVGRHYVRIKRIDPKFADFGEVNAYLAIGFGFVSAAFFQAIYNYIENPSAGFHITSDITFLGGLIGGVGAFLIGYFAYGRRKFGPRIVEFLPVAPLCITISQFGGRIGCFFAGCCYGKPTESCLGVHFPNLGYKAFPTQLFEAAFLLLLFSVLFHLAVRRNFKQTFVVYMVSYGAFRFLIEFIRDDPRGKLVGALSPSQTLSVLMVAGSVAVYFVTARLLRQYYANVQLRNKI